MAGLSISGLVEVLVGVLAGKCMSLGSACGRLGGGVLAGNGISFLGYGATRFLGRSGIQPQYAQKRHAVPRLTGFLCKVAEWVVSGV